MSSQRELGVAIKAYRIAANETPDNLAEAVEISTEQLVNIETGQLVPTREVLEMMISHFSLRKTEAERLWKLAGFEFNSEEPGSEVIMDEAELNALLPIQTILYTDRVHIAGNKYGLIIDFMQNTGEGKPVIVSRVGMSQQHAKSLIEIIKRALEQLEK